MEKTLASRIIDHMMAQDRFSQWLGIERIAEGPGHCTLRMRVRQEMLNGFAIAHGGIAYALSDSALAFASNAHGLKAVSIETSIAHVHPVYEGDTLTAQAIEDHLSRKIGVYRVVVTNQHNQQVALFKGTVYRTNQPWEV